MQGACSELRGLRTCRVRRKHCGELKLIAHSSKLLSWWGLQVDEGLARVFPEPGFVEEFYLSNTNVIKETRQAKPMAKLQAFPHLESTLCEPWTDNNSVVQALSHDKVRSLNHITPHTPMPQEMIPSQYLHFPLFSL